jgi:copper chaperone CopZ
MFRRNFLQRVTLTGASALAGIGTTQGGQTKTVTWRIKGFSCPTCAVGLEVMLQKQKGVTRATASYEKAMTTIEFSAGLVDESSLKSFITEMGFRVEQEPGR